jgi:hypothetical protein
MKDQRAVACSATPILAPGGASARTINTIASATTSEPAIHSVVVPLRMVGIMLRAQFDSHISHAIFFLPRYGKIVMP